MVADCRQWCEKARHCFACGSRQNPTGRWFYCSMTRNLEQALSHRTGIEIGASAPRPFASRQKMERLTAASEIQKRPTEKWAVH